jgi:hypothetical protein
MAPVAPLIRRILIVSFIEHSSPRLCVDVQEPMLDAFFGISDAGT